MIRSLWNLFRAEYLKVTGNRGVALGLVWIFPLGAALTFVLTTLIMAGSPPQYRTTTSMSEAMLSPWSIPGSELGRLLMIGLTATIFAGEYQWGTWKNIVPRRERYGLALVKFVAVLALMLVAFTLTSLVSLVGFGVLSLVADKPYVFGMAGSEFISTLGTYVLLAVLTTTIGAGYAGVASIGSRTVMAGILTGIGLVVLETLSIGILALLGRLLRLDLTPLYLLTPGYNITNLGMWLRAGEPMNTGPVMGLAPNSLETSLVILIGWVVLLVGLTVFLFRRQDITT